jgi:putative ABC transport system permease protein
MDALARLAPGATLDAAQASLAAVSAGQAAAHPETNRGWSARLVSAHESLVAPVRPALLMLSGAVGIVLLIACANVANLLLARASAREREVAVRLALGASRGRLARQFVTENLVLGAAGALLGLAIGRAGVAVLLRLSPGDIPRLDEAGLDLAVVGFTMAVSLAASAVLGLAPVIRVSRRGAEAGLQHGDRVAGTRSRMRASLVVAQMALALTLLAGGGLLVRTLHNLLAVPPGFDAGRLLGVNAFLAPPRYRELGAQYAFVRDALAAVRGLPGVDAAATVSHLPLSDGPVRLKLVVDGQPFDRAAAVQVAFRAISPDFFRTMGIKVQAGRPVADTDDETAAPVVVVNEALARRVWPGEAALGRRLAFVNEADGGRTPRWYEVVGVVADVKSRGLDTDEEPVTYVSFAQRRISFVRAVSLVVRTKGDPRALLTDVRRALQRVDPDLPVFGARPLEDVVSQSVAGRRFQAVLLQAFAALALLLSMIGVYGVLSDAVGQRTREIGVRVALGAQPGQVLRLVLRHGLTLALGGLAVGIPAAVALSLALKSFLFGVAPGDPWTLLAVSVLLTASAVLAAYVPARRATRVDPMTALRAD